MLFALSRFTRALMWATSVYSLLLWAYIVLRIVFSRIDVHDPFIDGIPISFWVLGLIAFVVSFSSTVIYLSLWGFSKNPWVEETKIH